MRIRSWAKDDNAARRAAWALAEYQGRQDLCCATGGGAVT
jgi:hypothetical protein